MEKEIGKREVRYALDTGTLWIQNAPDGRGVVCCCKGPQKDIYFYFGGKEEMSCTAGDYAGSVPEGVAAGRIAEAIGHMRAECPGHYKKIGSAIRKGLGANVRKQGIMANASIVDGG